MRMFAHTIYQGMLDDWFGQEYQESAERINQTTGRSVEDYGLVRNVCGMASFDKPEVAAE